ncbi:hypothetical protein V2W45_1335581 [Cenococcum geophilum]
MERLPKGVDAFVVYNVSPNLENPVLYGKKVGDCGALRNHIKKYSLGTRNIGKRGAPSIKKQEEAMVTLLKELGAKVPYTKYLDTTSIACLFKGCLNWSYFINNGLDDTKAPTAPAPTALASTKTSKKRLKKSSLKGLKAVKRNATKPARLTEEDITADLF